MNVQSQYPLEYRTPPLPLVALIGCNEVHKEVADFFVHQLRPPLVSLFTSAEATEQFVARNFGKGATAWACMTARAWAHGWVAHAWRRHVRV